VNEETLKTIRQRYELRRDDIARVMHEADLTEPPWIATTDATREWWRRRAELAIRKMERTDEGLIEWLAYCEWLKSERTERVAEMLDRLATEAGRHSRSTMCAKLQEAAAELRIPLELPERQPAP
jgi:hypothetical protein